MKYTINNSMITVEAENQVDNKKLFDLMNGKLSKAQWFDPPLQLGVRRHKKHRKHAFPKTCDVCGRVCKGLKGLGIHKATHKNESPLVAQGTYPSIDIPITTLQPIN